MRTTRGRFYATAVSTREDGKRFGHEVARQARTGREAAHRLTESGLPGYVQVWSDASGQRSIWAERRADGSWFSLDPFTGREVELDPETLRPVEVTS